MRSSLAFTRSERLGPPVAARISAFGSIALYEGLAADSRSSLRSLSGQLNDFAALPAASSDVDGATAAAAAARIVLDSMFRDGLPSTRRTIDSMSAAQIAARRSAGVSAGMSQGSVARGESIASAILAWAATDSFYATRGRPWTPPKGRQYWINTATKDQFVPHSLSGESDVVIKNNSGVTMDPSRASTRELFVNRPRVAGKTTLPFFDPVKPTEPYWGVLRTFVLRDGDECRPPAPPAYSEKPGTPFYQMAREFYDTVKATTPEKRQIALFWADNPIATGTPAFHWVSVMNQMVTLRHLSADDAAEVYALGSIAMADAFIGCWREKYRSYVVRPVTYVQRMWDAKYTTVFPTPPFPEYSSGHSVISGAGVQVLMHFLGDSTGFVDSTQVDIGLPPRPYRSLSAARNEVAISRVYGGIHYMKAVVDGLSQGECIGDRIVQRLKTRK
ncbi:MAG TPA: vanadium-dependent haloperoxidase [Gemmatimonadaceae bacterium]